MPEINPFSIIKSHVAILDVISQYTALKKAGMYWKGVCPFHAEKTASFTVSPHREIFYCFGCHAGGDVIAFISKAEQCSPIQAAQHLAERHNIDLPTDIKIESKEERQQYAHLCEQVANWCHQKLLKSPVALNYLKKRNVTQQSIDYFMLGYFPGGLREIKSFIRAMSKYNILAHDLLESNILSQGKSVLYSPFEDRLIFPIKDHVGRFCGFGGRIFKKNDTRAKYYNSRENEHFNKGSLLFGFDLAKKSIQKTKKVFLVEGYTDCVAMVQHGFENTVATLGTACTAKHLKQLSRHAQQAYVLYDGDNAGQQALLRLAQLCWQASIELHVIALPAQEDPASLLEKKEKLEPYIEQAQDLFTFFIQTLGSGFAGKSLSEKMQLTRTIINTIAKISDPLTQDFLLDKATKVLAIPFESLKRELSSAKRKNRARNERSSQVEPSNPNEKTANIPEEQVNPLIDSLDQIPLLEKKIFFAIMNNIHLFGERNNGYLVSYLSPPLRDILKKLSEEQHKQPNITFTIFFDTLEEQDKRVVSMLCLDSDETINETTFRQLLSQLQKAHWKRIVKDITVKIEQARAQGNKELVAQLIHRFEALKKPYHDTANTLMNKGYWSDDKQKKEN